MTLIIFPKIFGSLNKMVLIDQEKQSAPLYKAWFGPLRFKRLSKWLEFMNKQWL